VAWRWWHVAVALALFPVVGRAYRLLDIALGTPLHGGVYLIVGELVVWASVLWWLAQVSRRFGSGSFRRDYGFEWQRRDVPIGIGVGLVALVTQIGVLVVLHALTGSRSASTSQALQDVHRQNPTLFLVVALLPIVGAPIVEELVFRGLTLRALERRLSPTAAAAVAAGLFGASHWIWGASVISDLELTITLSVTGLWLGLLAVRTGRIGASIIAHSTLNIVVTLFILATG